MRTIIPKEQGVKTIIQYDLEEFHGEWEIVKQFDTMKEAKKELEYYQKHLPIKARIVGRVYKVLFERSER